MKEVIEQCAIETDWFWFNGDTERWELVNMYRNLAENLSFVFDGNPRIEIKPITGPQFGYTYEDEETGEVIVVPDRDEFECKIRVTCFRKVPILKRVARSVLRVLPKCGNSRRHIRFND